MRVPLVLFVFSSAISPVSAQQTEAPLPVPAVENKGDTNEYFDGRGHLIGTVSKIGSVTFFFGPDGAPLGTMETIAGQRVFKKY